MFEAMAALKTIEEYRKFFRDLCTQEELIDMADRWHAARLLVTAADYRQVADKVHISTTTVSRVAHWLWHGTGGYQLILKRLGLIKNFTK